MYLKAAEGLVIRDPATKTLIPAEGLEVPDGDLFWHRLIGWGDAVLAERPVELESVPVEDPPASAASPDSATADRSAGA